MFQVVLYQPEIAPNTGNVIRLCANTGCRLHLIRPLGFVLDDKRLRRAGLDYHEWVRVCGHDSYAAFVAEEHPRRILAFSTRARVGYTEMAYRPDDVFLFGPETRGLPSSLLDQMPPGHRLRIPMRPGQRSLNLSNAVAVVVFEAWRQLSFDGAA